MYINRAKALLLVGTISAGCVSGCEDEGAADAGAAGTAGAGAGGTPSAGAGGTPSAGAGGAGQGGGGSGGSPSAGSAGEGGGGAGGTGGTPSAGGSEQSGPDAGSPDASSPDAGGPDAGGAGGPDAGDAGSRTCDDTPDTIVTCDDLGQGDCSGQEGFLSVECEMLEFNMKPAVSNLARNCMIGLEPPELCAEENTYGCILGALEVSNCSDPEADDECTTIGAACGDSLSAFNACSLALSAMTQAGRDQMVQCMTIDTCDLPACIIGLDF